MRKPSFPQAGDMAYLIHKAIIVKDILEEFHLVKVCYIHSNNDFYIDVNALAEKPNFDINTLDITLFVEA